MTDKQPIDALILGGGGVKGLALAGAVIELEKHYTFGAFVGTSAGAIAAVLLAAGYGGDELRDELEELDTRSMVDGPLRAVWNLLARGGLHSGQAIQRWVARKLTERLYPGGLLAPANVTMNQLPHRAVVYASDAGGGAVTFDSHGEHDDTYAATAVRCSISIPGFFVPAERDLGGRFDGGLLNSFPAKIFLDKNPGASMIGVYLTSRKARHGRPRTLGLLRVVAQTVQIYLGGDEPRILHELKDTIVAVDTSPIKTLDFTLSPPEKQLLVLRGRIAARQYMVERGTVPPKDTRLNSLLVRAAAVAAQVAKRRRRRAVGRAARLSVGVLAALGVAALYRLPVRPAIPPFSLPLAGGTLHFIPRQAESSSGAAPAPARAAALRVPGSIPPPRAPAAGPAAPAVERKAAQERPPAVAEPLPAATPATAGAPVSSGQAAGEAAAPPPAEQRPAAAAGSSSAWRNSSGAASSSRAGR